MGSPAGKLKMHTYAGNTHALQSLIIARYNGIEIEVPAFEMGKDNKSPAFLAKSPMGKVPVLETAEGCICEAAAIARYVARVRPDTNMYGGSFFEAGLVDQWIEFAKNELDLPVGMWIYPILGFIASNAGNIEKAKDDLKRALAILDAHLLSHTFLAGEGVTAADVVVACSLLNAFKVSAGLCSRARVQPLSLLLAEPRPTATPLPRAPGAYPHSTLFS